MQKLTLLAFLLFFAPKALSAQCLSGTYTLGSKGDFENFDSLQQALNDFGVCGPYPVVAGTAFGWASIAVRHGYQPDEYF